jgi:predicted DCC family thiol-disulfide oxidoreductase YuxK
MPAARHTLLYDDTCPLCVAQMRWVRRFDWLRRFRALPLNDGSVAQLAPGLSRAALAEAIHCVTADGRIVRSAGCVRFVALRLPPLTLPALFLWMPGASWLAERVYRQVSRHRHQLSRIVRFTKPHAHKIN